jgi:hypothetical protein
LTTNAHAVTVAFTIYCIQRDLIMKKTASILLVLGVIAFAAAIRTGRITLPQPRATAAAATVNQTLASAISRQSSGVQVNGSGKVIRILSDDNDGSRHQRFILRLSSGQTLLIAHNIDLAPRVKPLKKGDRIEFYGEYAWNSRGGVIHWTHHDPADRHPSGWLKRKGKTFK